MVLFICLVLAGAAIGFTLMVREKDIPPAPAENPELKHLETRRQVLYENLKDLQFEYHQGKLTEEDYHSLKQGFLYDLAGVMDSIERLKVRSGKPSKAQPKPAAARDRTKLPATEPAAAPAASGAVCPSCKANNPPANRFCGQCGQPLGS
ncbi:MAG TPA: zinc ribbon domain-containing protein [Terriglobia bacterium]|nr:zinc ribbon domain-containing protein [Terriglobia bacterium]